jgi:hypothetical protein
MGLLSCMNIITVIEGDDFMKAIERNTISIEVFY